MKVLKNKRDGNTVFLEIEEDEKKVLEAQETAFKKLVKHAKIPGFRQGKVTRNIFEKHYGREIIIEEALKDIIDVAYREALKDLQLDIVDYAKNLKADDYKEGKPFKFSLEVEVKPLVKLGKYKGLKVNKEPEKATEEQIQDYINQMLDRYADFVDVDRAIEKDDFAKINMIVTVDDNKYDAWSRNDIGLKVGADYYGEDFNKKIEGMRKGEKRNFQVKYDDNFINKDLAGKEVSFEVEMIEIKAKKQPEFNDDFVKKVSEYKTVDELKENIIKNLNEQAKQHSLEKLKTDLLEQIINGMKVDIPSVMIDREVDNTLYYFDSNLRQSGSNLELYLKRMNKHIDDLKAEVRDGAEKQVKVRLALDEIIAKENIEVTDEELNAEIVNLKLPEVKNLDDLKEKFKNIYPEDIKMGIKDRKVYDLLIKEAKISN